MNDFIFQRHSKLCFRESPTMSGGGGESYLGMGRVKRLRARYKSRAIVVWQQAPLQWLPMLLICEMRGAGCSLWCQHSALNNGFYEWHSGLMNMNMLIKIGMGPSSVQIGSDSHMGRAWLTKETTGAPGIENTAGIRPVNTHKHTRTHWDVFMCSESYTLGRLSG